MPLARHQRCSARSECRQVERRSISHMRAHRQDYEGWCDGCRPSLGEEAMEDFGKYLGLVQVQGALGAVRSRPRPGR